MGIYHKGLNGPFSGRVGNIIGSSWRNVTYMKSLPRRNKGRPGERTAWQNIWKEMTRFLSPYRYMLDVGFCREGRGRKTAANAALGYNLTHAVVETEKGYAINFPAVRFSTGSLPRTDGVKVERVARFGYEVSWPAGSTSPFIAEDDKVSVVAYCSGKEYHLASFQQYERKDGRLLIGFPEEVAGDTAHLYIFFTSTEGDSSPSVYLGGCDL